MVLYYTLSFIPHLVTLGRDAAWLHNNNNKCSEAGKTHRLGDLAQEADTEWPSQNEEELMAERGAASVVWK